MTQNGYQLFHVAMPTLRTKHETDQVKVAVVFELDQFRPVWFQAAGRTPVEIVEICSVWYCARGSARIINFDVWDRRERYCLEYNAESLSWSLGRTIIE